LPNLELYDNIDDGYYLNSSGDGYKLCKVSQLSAVFIYFEMIKMGADDSATN
jgi:hypothetical protein